MTTPCLESVAGMPVADEKGILAADETTPTLTERFNTLGIQSTERARRNSREMFIEFETSPSVMAPYRRAGATTDLWEPGGKDGEVVVQQRAEHGGKRDVAQRTASGRRRAVR